VPKLLHHRLAAFPHFVELRIARRKHRASFSDHYWITFESNDRLFGGVARRLTEIEIEDESQLTEN
jgi:hypothetical protein